ncbi:MAG: RNA 3'-terminal phosphate cyclase [Desulfovibrionales bacterium]|nr:RNA 3'-terminal phosphate cyclase [Desulfovibrionales bacterium]
MIEIDGSYGEGGGQILRTALSLSCLLQKPFRIYNIRANRKNPGLRPQHLAGVRAAKAISQAAVDGATIGSTTLAFRPVTLKGGKYLFDVAEERGSAGSVSLVFQTISLPLAFAGELSDVTIKGGTHVPWSPPFHYLAGVFIPTIEGMGMVVDAHLERWGWYPMGEGIVHFSIKPVTRLKGISKTDKLQPEEVTAISAASNLPEHIITRQKRQLLKRIFEDTPRRAAEGITASCEEITAPSIGQGTFVFLRVRGGDSFAGFSALGARGKRAEEVADEAAALFLSFLDSQAAVDRHLADQLIPYMAMADGESKIFTAEITLHLMTNIWVVEQFTQAKFHVEGTLGTTGIVTCLPDKKLKAEG